MPAVYDGAGAAGDAVDVPAALGTAAGSGARHVTLGDGELLASPELPTWVAAAKSAGFVRIELETSAVPLARPELAARLRDLGVAGVAVPLFGADADAHDWVVGQPGAMQRALRGIRAAHAAGLRVRVLAPVLRPTYRGLDQLVGRCLPLGVPAFTVVAPVTLPPGLLANPALAAPFVRRALALASAARREVDVRGVPACLLAEQALRGEAAGGPECVVDARRPASAFDNDSGDNAAAACESCRWRAHCAVPGPALLAAFGEAGLQARSDAPPRRRTSRAGGGA
ncbi:MAG: hypothetical protein RIT45_1606 [Pseudomonadota bacterium]|jgi:hypothetical protein